MERIVEIGSWCPCPKSSGHQIPPKIINLPSLFKDKSDISSIPTYFENKESLSFVISTLLKIFKGTLDNFPKMIMLTPVL